MTAPSGGDNDAGADRIELLSDVGRYESAPGATTEQMSRSAGRWRTGAAVGVAALAIAGAVAGLSQVGGGSPTPTTAPPTTVGASAPASAAELSPFSAFPADLPTELPGLLMAFDSLGSVVIVDRAADRPVEVRVGLIPDTAGGAHGLGLGGAEPMWFAQAFTGGSTVSAVGPSGDPLGDGIDLRRLGPEGEVLLAERSPDGVEAAVVPLNHLGTRENNDLRWQLPPDGVRLLGVWNGQLLVTQGAATWLLPTSGSGPSPAPVAVGSGEVIGFDGRWLVRRACTEPGRCGLTVGSPDQPDRFPVPAPVVLVAPGRAPSGIPGSGAPGATTTASTAPAAPEPQVGSWAGPVAVTPDGSRLAGAVRFGDLVWLTVVDLATGAVERYDSSLSPGALVAWAPDGAWLAFQTGRDLQIRRQRDGRTWILGLDRDLVTLRWSPGPTS